MARELEQVFVAPKGMGLNDFVAMQEGFFEAEGLAVEFDMKTFKGTQSSWKNLEYLGRPQDQVYAEKRDVLQSACAWGTVCNAGAGMGRIVRECYGISPWAIYVNPKSNIQKPEDLRDVPIAVGMRAGSHFNVPYRLEAFMPLENIKAVNVGGFGARLQALISGEFEASSLLPPQIAMAEQLGYRKIIENTFHTIWWAPSSMSASALAGYIRALDRAEKALDADPAKYLPLWDKAVPAEFQDQVWDYSKFGRGERFVAKTIPDGEFDEIVSQAGRWGLDDFMQEKDWRKLLHAAA